MQVNMLLYMADKKKHKKTVSRGLLLLGNIYLFVSLGQVGRPVRRFCVGVGVARSALLKIVCWRRMLLLLMLMPWLEISGPLWEKERDADCFRMAAVYVFLLSFSVSLFKKSSWWESCGLLSSLTVFTFAFNVRLVRCIPFWLCFLSLSSFFALLVVNPFFFYNAYT